MTTTHTFSKGDMVASQGRIKTRFEDRKRFISFQAARVTDVSGTSVTVNPAGMRVHLICQADDLTTLQPVPKPQTEAPVLTKPSESEAPVTTPEPEPEAPKKVSNISKARKLRKQSS